MPTSLQEPPGVLVPRRPPPHVSPLAHVHRVLQFRNVSRLDPPRYLRKVQFGRYSLTRIALEFRNGPKIIEYNGPKKEIMRGVSNFQDNSGFFSNPKKW